MRRSIFVALVLTALITACRHRASDRDADFERPCDPRGPRSRSRDFEEVLESFEERYVAQELFADEQVLRKRCRWHELVAIEDEVLKAQCHAFAGKSVPATSVEACRRACLVSGRAEVAAVLYEQIARELGDIDTGFRASVAMECSTALQPGRRVLRGDDASRLWRCLGLEPLPRRMRVEIVVGTDAAGAAGRHIERVVVDGPLIPNGGVYSFVYGIGDHGCGVSAFGVEAFAPETE
jgi:hypothetical protein